jgi:hypothetical protein
MDADRERAYRIVLSAATLHLKWDLCGVPDRFSWLPWRRREQIGAVRRARHRAVAFHNLAIFAARDFAGFREDEFWADVDRFYAAYPEAKAFGSYREMFEASLRGEHVDTFGVRLRSDD